MKIGFNCNLDPALANPMTKLLRPLTILSQLITVQWQNYSLILCPNRPIPWQFPSFLEQFSSTSMTILTNAPPTHPLPWHSGLISLQKRPIPSHSMTEQNRTVKKMIHPETVLSFHVTFHPHPVTTGSHLVTILSYPVTILSYPVTILSYPVTILSYPVTILSYPVTILSYPVTILSNPVTILSYPVAILSYPVTILSYPVTILSFTLTILS